MEYAYDVEFHGRRMNAETAREEVYHERLRPFYLLRPTVTPDGNQWCCLYGDNLQSGVSAFGDTPDQASKNFDVAWLNQKCGALPPGERRIGVADVERLRAAYAVAVDEDWTASLCDRLNSLVRENTKYFSECKDGPTAADLIQSIHGQFNQLRLQLAEAVAHLDAAQSREMKWRGLIEGAVATISVGPSTGDRQWLDAARAALAICQPTKETP